MQKAKGHDHRTDKRARYKDDGREREGPHHRCAQKMQRSGSRICRSRKIPGDPAKHIGVEIKAPGDPKSAILRMGVDPLLPLFHRIHTRLRYGMIVVGRAARGPNRTYDLTFAILNGYPSGESDESTIRVLDLPALAAWL